MFTGYKQPAGYRPGFETKPFMKKTKQLSFIKPSRKFFGGALLKGRRKSIRPLSSKDSIHFVLRSQWAMGSDSFLAARNRAAIDRIINRFAQSFGVRIYQRAVNSNHIHLILCITNRILYRAFIKAVSGRIASHVMGQQSFKLFSKSRVRDRQSKLSSDGFKRGDGAGAAELSSSFWQFRPFSRVVNWGKDFQTCVKYLKLNILEAVGFIPYRERKNYYARWLNETLLDLNKRVRALS